MKGFGGIKALKKMQEEMARIQQQLGSKRIEATSGGGMVRAVMNGHGELVELAIDPQVVDPQDVEMLQDLVLAAVNEAKRKVQQTVQEEMARLIPPGLGANIPGLFG